MCNLRLSIPRFEKNFEIDFFHYFPDIEERMAPMVIDGLIRFDPDSIDITERGRLFLRNIAMQFDAYLGTNDVVFSRTV
ncbi:MAG: oxygen-independent coproporphyrinogen III oxidase [Chlorobi bacterium OLB7]|nr:MAG: oxygen-independent coproporphyrinogen III oxidase [Chlorobi bacterium OLB7]